MPLLSYIGQCRPVSVLRLEFACSCRNLLSQESILAYASSYNVTVRMVVVTGSCYCIMLCVSYIVVKICYILPYVARTVVRTSLPHHRQNPQRSYLTNSHKSCFTAICTCKKPVSRMHDVIIAQVTSRL